MPDTIIPPGDTTEERIERLERVVERLTIIVTRIGDDLARSTSPIALEAPDGTLSIRDPDIIAQQQLTGTRGYIPHPDPPAP